MDILITGATGFIGKQLVKNLSKKHKIRCLIRTKNKENIAFLKKYDVDIRYGDLTNSFSMINICKDIDVIIHASAKLLGNEKNKEAYYKVNVRGTKFLIDDAKKNKIKKFIFFSTAGVFGPVLNADENTPIKTTNIYEKTKAEAETFVKNSGLNFVIIRPGLVFGPQDKRFGKIFLLAEKGYFPLLGKGNTKIQPIFINDLISILEKLIAKNVSKETIIIAGNKIVTLKQFVKLINPDIYFIYLPKKIMYFLAHVGSSMENFFRKNFIFNLNRFFFLTESRTFNIEKVNNLTKYKFTNLEKAIHLTKKENN